MVVMVVVVGIVVIVFRRSNGGGGGGGEAKVSITTYPPTVPYLGTLCQSKVIIEMSRRER